MDSVLELHIKNKEFNHGYLLVGDIDISRNMAMKAANILLKTEDELEAHPDFYYQKFDLFSIKDSVDLRQKISVKPFWGDKKVFIAEIFSFSIESANALLKTFEEPTESTHFFIIVSSVEDVLPTLRSRLTIIDFSGKIDLDREKYDFCEKFLKSLPSKRLEIIKDMLTKDFSQNKKMAIELVNGLEFVIVEKFKNFQKNKIPDFYVLEEIQKSREFLFGRSSSVKMILEHLALVLPKV